MAYNAPSPGDKKRMLAKAGFMISCLGMTQKQTAKELGISEQSMSAWARAYGWRDKNQQKLQYADSLSSFMVYLKKKHPKLYEDLAPVYETFTTKY